MSNLKKLVLVLAVAGLAAGPACGPRNVRSVRVGSTTIREIRIIARAGSMTADVLAVVDRRGHFIVPPLSSELAEITEVLVSPRHDRVVVISVGEGHQYINVYRLADWLGQGTGPGEAVRPWRSMDPYPHSWADTAWSVNGQVVFSSSGDYGRFDAGTRRPGPVETAAATPREWIWNVETDTVVPRTAGKR
jgi:hypothetical protein